MSPARRRSWSARWGTARRISAAPVSPLPGRPAESARAARQRRDPPLSAEAAARSAAPPVPARSCERTVHGRALFREEFRPLLGHVQAVLEPDPEFAVDGNGGFVAEAHAGSQPGAVATDEVGPLMPVQPDAVAGAVRQARHLVARPEPRIGDDFPGRVVHRSATVSYTHLTL